MCIKCRSATVSLLSSSMRALSLGGAKPAGRACAKQLQLLGGAGGTKHLQPSVRALSTALPALRTMTRPSMTSTSTSTAAKAVGATDMAENNSNNNYVGGVQQQTRGMKVGSSIKKRCEHCKIVTRKRSKRGLGYRYVICSANPRHKQRQG